MKLSKQINNSEPLRYIINGVLATLVHFLVLNFNIYILDIKIIGIANFIAAIFGITVSFIGSRYFVYKNHNGTILHQGIKFIILYGLIAFFHGLVLYIWSDIYKLDFRVGFVVATFMQMIFSYSGNKFLVFTNKGLQ